MVAYSILFECPPPPSWALSVQITNQKAAIIVSISHLLICTKHTYICKPKFTFNQKLWIITFLAHFVTSICREDACMSAMPIRKINLSQLLVHWKWPPPPLWWVFGQLSLLHPSPRLAIGSLNILHSLSPSLKITPPLQFWLILGQLFLTF